MKKYAPTALAGLFAAFCLLTGCCKEEPFSGTYKSVMIYYGCGYNNLVSDLHLNITEDLTKGELPGKNTDRAILAFIQEVEQYGDYTTPTTPYLLKIYKDGDKAVIDTVDTYPAGTIGASAGTLKSVLEDIAAKYESESYGLVFSSHGTGWLPDLTTKADSPGTAPNWVGAHYASSYTDYKYIEIPDFAAAIPYKLDYIVFDACLMGGIEVAWELKDVCDHIVFSPTEILTGGLDYTAMPGKLLRDAPDLKGLCDSYYEKYSGGSYSPYAAITLVDCGKTASVGTAMASIISNHREEADNIDPALVQGYFYSYSPVTKCFFDLRSAAVQMGATDGELSKLDAALADFITYERHTDFFFDLRLNDSDGNSLVCGISMFLPSSKWASYNQAYKSTAWNKITKLIDN